MIDLWPNHNPSTPPKPARVRVRYRVLLTLLVGLGLCSAVASEASSIREHREFDRLLRAYVHDLPGGQASVVDYAGFARERDRLRGYLQRLSAVPSTDFAAWPWADRQAFLINAYNAATIETVLGRYPDLDSIKDLGGLLQSPWQQPVLDLLGKTRSLDDIEHVLMRGSDDYRDPRIHFAVNCASIGCPALRNEAYTGAKLQAQLEDQTRRFLADRSRNRYDAVAQSLLLSPIFDWYRADFERLSDGLDHFLLRYADILGLDAPARSAASVAKLDLRFGDYDWRLNRSEP